MTARVLPAVLVLPITAPAMAQGGANSQPPGMAELSLEGLMNAEITPVSKKPRLLLVGQNLLHDRHAEYISRVSATQISDVERSVCAGATWRFSQHQTEFARTHSTQLDKEHNR
jgi:hypothetical protein